MSLINKMLQDLEARQAVGQERIASNHVRPLPPGDSGRSWSVVAVVVAAVVILAAAGAHFLLPWSEDPPPAPSRAFKQGVLGTPAVAPAASPASAPAVATVEATPPVETAPAPALPWAGSPSPADMPLVAALESVGHREAFGLRVTTELAVPSPQRPREDPKPAAAKPSQPAGSPQAKPAPARTGEGPAKIEKQNRILSVQERAVNEYRDAISFLNDGRPGAAMEGLRSALRSDPALEEARLLLSSLLLEKRHLEEARAVLLEGLERDPALPRLAMTFARIQVEQGDSGGAADTLAKAATAARENADYRGFHAAVLQRLGRHKDAAAEFHAALRLKPDSGLWWMGLGISLEADGQRGQAREALLHARDTRRLTPELDRFVQQKLQALAAAP